MKLLPLFVKKQTDMLNNILNPIQLILGPKSIFHDLKPTNRNEIKAFLGLCILMGIVSKPRGSMFWSTDSFYHTPIFGQVMSRKRFQLCKDSCISKTIKILSTTLMILKEIRFFKIRTLMDMARQNSILCIIHLKI